MRPLKTAAFCAVFIASTAFGECVLPTQPALMLNKLPALQTRARLFSDVTAFTPITLPGTTISSSGHYLLENDLTVTTTGIIITASNVVLDLDNRTIDGTGGGIDGIAVSSGASNVTIGNGYISSMSQHGIFVQGDHCTIKNCTMRSNLYGIALTGGTYCTIDECSAFDNGIGGFYLTSSTNNFITSCDAINTGSSVASFGFFSSSGARNVFNNCVSVDTHTTGSTFGNFPSGFGLTGTETQSIISNCTSNHTYVPTTGLAQPFGIALNSTLTGVTAASQATDGTTINAIEWIPGLTDTTILAVGGSLTLGDNVRIYSYDFADATLTPIAQAPDGDITRGISWSSTGAYLAAVGDQGLTFLVTGRVYKFIQQDSVASLSLVATTTDMTTTNACDWSPNNNYLATGLDDGDIAVHQFDRSSLTRLDTKNHGASVRAVQFSHSGNFVAIAGDESDADIKIFSFNGSTLTLLTTATHGASVNSIAWSQTDDFVAIGGASSSSITTRVYQFNGSTLTQVASSNFGATVQSVVWTPRGLTLGVAGQTAVSVQLKIYTFTGAALAPVSSFAHGATIFGASIDPVNDLVAIGGNLANLDPQNGVTQINNIRVLKASISGVSNCAVTDNTVYYTTGGLFPGIGIALSGVNNYQNNNTTFFNDVNEQF